MSLEIQSVRTGAELVSIKWNGKEMLHQGADCTDKSGKVYWKRRSPILFPIVGKLKKNQTMIDGRIYEMMQHGFARDLEFEPITKMENFHSYVLRSNNTTHDKYPFTFSLFVTYTVEENKLTVQYRVMNDGDSIMPFGIGGHPAFKLDMPYENYYLEFEQEEKKIHFLYLIDGLIGTDYGKNILYKDKAIVLEKESFKNDAIIMKGLTSHNISLKTKRDNKKILTFDFSGFPYLALWSKPNAPFLCIEPWQTTADRVNADGVFRNKERIIQLEPKKEFSCKYSIEFF